MKDWVIFLVLAIEIPLILFWILRKNARPMDTTTGFRITCASEKDSPEVLRFLRTLDCDVRALKRSGPSLIYVRAEFPLPSFSAADFISSVSSVSAVRSVILCEWEDD